VVADTLVFGQEIGRLDLEERFLVSEGLKGRMEREVFAHVVLRPVHAVGSPGAVARFETEPYWEWATDLISPPPAQGPARFVRGGRPLAPDEVPASGGHSREGWEFPEVLYPLELRFRRRDLLEAGPFDLAAYHSQAHGAWLSMTNHPERRGRTDLPPLPVAVSRPRIASRRFFEFCVREGLPFTWRPVYVVD